MDYPKLRGTLSGNTEAHVFPYLLGNSVSFVLNRFVTITSGLLALCTDSDERPLGLLIGFVDKNGGVTDFDSGSTTTVTTEDDNDTDKKIKGIIVDDPAALYIIDADDDLAQSNVGQYFDLNNAYQIDVGDAHDSAGAFQLLALDPQDKDDASLGLYRIAEHELAHL